MAEIPRKPTFPDHVIKKLINRIEQQVQQNVIPVSTGIYTEQKLVNLLQAIPKPVLVDYDERIFFQLTQKLPSCPFTQCPICHHDYNNKKKPIMCHFCQKWACDECICHRQRLHPLDNNHNGKRYSICYECDAKYLSLQLNHSYVYNRMIIQNAIVEISKQLQNIQTNLDTETTKIQAIKAEPKRKLNMKLSILKKQELDSKKAIKKAVWDIQTQKDKRAKLQQKLIQTKIKYQKIIENKTKQEKKKEIQRKQREKRQEQQFKQRQQRRIQQEQRRIQEQIQKQRLQKLRKQQQQAQRIERQKQKERLKQLQLQLEKEREKQKRRQLQKQLQQQKKRKRQLEAKKLQKQKQIQKHKQKERKKQIERLKQIQIQKKNQFEKQQQKIQKQKQEKQIKQKQQIRQKQIQDLKQKLQMKNKLEKQQSNRISHISKKLGQSTQFDQYFKETSPQEHIAHPDNFLQAIQSSNGIHDTSTNQISFTFDPSKNNQSQQQKQAQNSHRNSYLFNQFKSYFTQQIIKNAPTQVQISMNKITSNESAPISSSQKQQIMSKFRRSLQQQQQKAAQSEQINSAKLQIFKQANKKRRNYQDMKQNDDEQQVAIVTLSQKCKCSIF